MVYFYIVFTLMSWGYNIEEKVLILLNVILSRLHNAPDCLAK